jgi:hypothetical protein
LVAGWLIPASSNALSVDSGYGVGFDFTDNVRHSATNPQDEVIGLGYVGLKIDDSAGAVFGSATSSLTYQTYTQDNFGDQEYFSLDALGGWRLINNRFEIIAQDHYSQRRINALDPLTPDNTQNSNVFSLNPNITLAISARQQLLLRPSYRNFYYEQTRIDNDQSALAAIWSYQWTRTTALSLQADTTRVDYEEALLSDNDRSSIHLAVDMQRARTQYRMDIGSTLIERDGGNNLRATTGSANWQTELSRRSRMRVNFISELTDTSARQLRDVTTNQPVDVEDQVSADELRNRSLRVEYIRDDSTLTTRIFSDVRKQDYQTSADDRDINASGLDMRYAISQRLSMGGDASFNTTHILDIDRRDDNTTLGTSLTYKLSRDLRAEASLQYRKRRSTTATNNFEEWNLLLNLVYGFGSINRPNGG